MTMAISLVICTRDRASDLELTLASLREVVPPAGTELLIVDNGSHDRTSEVAGAFDWPGAQVKYIVEAVPGQARARNRAILEAKGDLIVFTDDDVRFSARWLEELVSPILDGSADGATGQVRIAENLQRPWMTPARREFFASTECLEDPPSRLVGASMAFHRRVLSKVPKFDERLGPGALGFADDTVFSWQLLAAGFRLKLQQSAVVVHHFDGRRLEFQGLLDSARKHGRTRAYVDYHWLHEDRPWATLRLIKWWLALGCLKLFPRTSKGCLPWFERMGVERRFHYSLQYMREKRTSRRYSRHGLVLLASS